MLGETEKVYNFGVAYVDEDGEKHYNSWSEKKLPMAIFKPFGYSAGPTQLMTAAFWIWLVFGILLHAWQYVSSKKIREAEEMANAEKDGVKTLDHMETGQMDNSDQAKDDVSTDDSYNEFVKTVEAK